MAGLEADNQGELVGIVVHVDEAIVQQEASVALFPVAIVNLLASLDVVGRLDDETFTFVAV